MLAAMSKTEQRIDRNRGGITDTQVRFYQVVRKVVNIFAPRVLRAATFWGAHASRVLATPKAFASRGLPLSARNQNQMAKFMESSFRRDAETSTRDACATQLRPRGRGCGVGRGLGVT